MLRVEPGRTNGAYPARYAPTVDSTFDLVAVAFVHAASGRVRVLLAVDRDGSPLFDGEPALLFEHRHGRPSTEAALEGADRIDAAAVAQIARRAHEELAALVESAFDETGMFDGQRMLGRSVSVRAAHEHFGA